MTRNPPESGAAGARSWRRAAVALGSNLGDRARHLDQAVLDLRALPGVRVLDVSEWIETAPVGAPEGSPSFLNGALLLETELDARELLEALLAIERAHGRVRPARSPGEARTLDLDLLVFDDLKIEDEDLRLPHPRMEERTFVLQPLARIAPDLLLPSGRTAEQQLAELSRAPR
ncbi:MAG TPA: 2-amino-4-hydroxy-6-hydroxymethyldihydropteridine diphosphokinase [Planctomycetota bacterium]|jgi:2-amino-4-hydroxy-6-hydroxymethyldihydropteridine diphosphokinase|nr:2-amino-4-hydroxy-6-hydroxymethyldihydropteridine diphosphokinase [Planctomycetota bacterium]